MRNDNGVIRLQGGMSGGTSAKVFTLPVGMRPPTTVWVRGDSFGASRGQFVINPNGEVFVDMPSLPGASSFMSFEGVSFGI